MWAQRDARLRGFAIDEKGLQEATDFLLAPDNRARILPVAEEPEPPGSPYSLIAVFTTPGRDTLNKINANIGLAHDPVSKALFDLVTESLKK